MMATISDIRLGLVCLLKTFEIHKTKPLLILAKGETLTFKSSLRRQLEIITGVRGVPCKGKVPKGLHCFWHFHVKQA